MQWNLQLLLLTTDWNINRLSHHGKVHESDKKQRSSISLAYLKLHIQMALFMVLYSACTSSWESLGKFQKPPKLITGNHSSVSDNCLRNVSKYTVHLQHCVPWAVLHCYSCLLGKFLYSYKSYELLSSPPKQVGAAWNRCLSLKTQLTTKATHYQLSAFIGRSAFLY